MSFSPLAYEAIVYSDSCKGLSGGIAADKQKSDNVGVIVSCVVMTCACMHRCICT